MIPLRPLAVVLLALAASSPALAEDSARRVADLKPGLDPLGPDPGIVFRAYTPVAGGRVVFLGSQPEVDPAVNVGSLCGLWTTDGTEAGTARLVDLCGGVDLVALPRRLASTGTLAFFSDGSNRLWRTDGTAAGTFLLGTVAAGASPGEPLPPLAPDGRTLLFSGCADGDCNLWRSAGTVAGTRLLKDVHGFPSRFARAGGSVLFATPTAIWSTDGTAPRTIQLAPVPSGRTILQLFPHGNQLYFIAATSNVSDLWVLDLTTRKSLQLQSFNTAPGTTGLRLHEAGGRVLATYHSPLGDNSLWTTNGTRRGTRRLGDTFLSYFPLASLFDVGGRAVYGGGELRELAPGAAQPAVLSGCPGGCPRIDDDLGEPGAAVVFQGRLFFTGATQAGGQELWTTDGTGPGTRLFKSLCAGPCSGGPIRFRVLRGRLLFADARGNLWVSDGTRAGTLRLAPVATPPFFENPVDVAFGLHGLVFTGVDSEAGPQPWRSDLTPGGAERIAVLGIPPAASSWPAAFQALGGKVLFEACDESAGWIWASDGTAAGTVRLPGSTPCPEVRYSFSLFRRLGDRAFYFWNDTLRITDGTPGGTTVLLNLPSGGTPVDEAVLGGKLLFALPPDSFPPSQNGWLWTFWTSDGTPAGTRAAFPYRFSGSPGPFTVADGLALFEAQQADPPTPLDLWRTDGTEAGTFPLLTLRMSTSRNVPAVVLGGRTYFLADARGGRELWVTDGTAAGTTPVFPDPNGPRDPLGLTLFQGALYFAALGDPGHPQGIWRSDGTAAGTVLVKAVDLGFRTVFGNDLFPQLTPAGDQLFFRAQDAAHGLELWKTDGTPEGTALLKDIRPGPLSSVPFWSTAAGDELYFTASDGGHGTELWRSDGTEAGTELVQDIVPGPGSSSPQQPTAADGTLFFNAWDFEHGRELWALPR